MKSTAAILSLALLSTGAFAQALPEAGDKTASSQASFGVLRYEVVADLHKARASGAWPVRESNDIQAVAIAPVHRASHHVRKEYPNVMGMSIEEWLASREAAAGQAAGE